MRNRAGSLLLGALLVVCATSVALAANYPIVSAVFASSDVGVPVYMRYYNPNVGTVNPIGESICVSPYTWNATTRECQLNWRSIVGPPAATGYKAPTTDVFNDNGNLNEPRYAVYDLEFGTGTGSHAGYYFFAGSNVAGTELSDWKGTDCSGAFNQACLGQGNTTNAAGTGQTYTGIGAVNPVQGFRPIPVPVPTFNAGTGNVDLSWNAASIVSGSGLTTAPSYDLYVAKKACGSSVLSTDYALLKNVTGTSTSVAKADLALSGNTCAWFAIMLHYPNAAALTMTSKYLSANSLPVSYDASAATVTGLRAMYMRNLGVQVSFKTTSESNTQGFYVARSFSPNGPFVRVSPLIAAKGEANSYTYMDATRALVLRGGKVYYRVDVVSRDGKANSFGPVLVDIPGSNNRAPLTPATNSRFATQR